MWVYKIAEKIINNNPAKDEYILNCGTSTTGLSHIGNFREISIVYFVKRALEIMGKKASIILSFDDYDRFKKVPTNTDPGYAKYIAMPVCDIPSPCCNKSFSQYYEDLFLKELNELEIDFRYINQFVRYKSREYSKYYNIIFNKRREIANIINRYKTQATENAEIFFPFSIYCENCNKDLVKVKSIYDNKKIIEYKCDNCGFVNKIEVKNGRLKPIFKVEWPMRWVHECVDFEPSGRSHMTKNGAYDVACDICKNIFKSEPPIAEAYEFVELKGSTNRMSKTSGKTYTITDLLRIYSKKMLLWIFANQHPSQVISIDLSDDVVKNYAEYERFLKSSQTKDLELKKLLDIDEAEISLNSIPFKSLVAEICAFTKDDDIIFKYSKDLNNRDSVAEKLKFASNWVEINSKKHNLLKEPNLKYSSLLTQQQIEQLKVLKKCIIDYKKDNIISLQNLLKKEIEKRSNFNIKECYKDFYNLIFGEDRGAPIEKIVNYFNCENVLRLLEVL